MAVELKTTLNQNVPNPFKHAVGLSAVWEKCMSEFYATDIRSLIPKEHGQLGNLKKSLGMKQASEVVQYAIRNWGQFAQKAANNVGSDIFPPKPSVGWLCQYHAIAALMQHGELQSIAKKQADEEHATKEAQAKESKEPAVTLIQLTSAAQINAWCDRDDPANEAFIDKVKEKYGEWRPAKGSEKGIPCDIELKKAG